MSVTVGGSDCPITSLTESALQCTPPETPKAVDGSGYSTVNVCSDYQDNIRILHELS